MKLKLLPAILCLLCISFAVNAQAPKITYSAGAKVYTTGVPIQTLSPVNTGGAVPQSYYGQVTTFCGNGKPGYQDGNAATASFRTVRSQCVDAQGNIFMADEANHVIRKITPDGVMTTFAGSDDLYRDGIGKAAGFRDPRGITIDAAGNLYVISDRRVRKITPDAVVTTIAGSDYSGSVNGTGADASFSYLISIIADSKGNLYVSDYDVKAIRKVTPQGVVTTFAGSVTEAGLTDGNAATARFNSVNCLAIDKQDNIIAGDEHRIRKITPKGAVTTVGTAEMLGIDPQNDYVSSVATDPTGNIYFTANHIVNVISPAGVVNRVAGTPGSIYTGGGKTDGIGTLAQFKSPGGLVYDGKGNLYLAEYQNYLVRKINVTGYIINKPLPAGLKFDQLTGDITGFATEITPPSDYVVTAFNAAGSSAFAINMATIVNRGKPAVTSFSPLSGGAGTLVTIHGTNLVNTLSVAIGGLNTAVISNTNTEVVVMVMPGALTGAVTLGTANGYATASGNFKLVQAYASFVPQTKITAADVKGLAQFGWATALSADGKTLIVGAHTDNNNVGAAYIYTRNGDNWTMEARLTGIDVEGQAGQGISVAITADGNMAIVGGDGDNNAIGAAWIYTRSGKIWTQQGQKLVPSGISRQQAEGSIVAVSADGSTIVVGGNSQAINAVMTVYNRVNGTWAGINFQLPLNFQQNNTIAINASGNVIAVGQPTYNGNTGIVRVYSKLALNGWFTIPPYELVQDAGANGSQFGSSISISADGKFIIVGAPNFNNGQGAAWAFKRQYPLGNPWDQKYRIDLPAGDKNVRMFGRLVSANADCSTIAVADISNTGKQELRFFKRADDQFTQQGNPVTPATNNATYYGNALSISADGSMLAAGNHFDNGSVGSVAVYKAILLPEVNTLNAVTTLQDVSLKGSVNGNGLAATVSFEYSTSVDMSGAKVIPADGKSSVTADQGTVAFSATLSGLTAGVTYYYRITAVSSQGTVNGLTEKFVIVPGPPVVTSFTPVKGAVGTVVTITGSNLIGPKSVMIGGAPALVISATGKQMTAMVMPGTLQGGLTVTTPAGSVHASESFNVLPTSQPNYQQQPVLDLDNTIVGNKYRLFNSRANISADGKTAIFGVGVDGKSDATGLWMYKRNGETWEKQSDRLATSGNLCFTDLSADGNTAVFTNYASVDDQGWPSTNISVYKRDGETWSKQAEFKPKDAIPYSNPYHIALSADGNTLVTGTTSSYMRGGIAWVYTREGGIWTQQGGQLVCQDAVDDNEQEVQVAISADGNTIALGGYNDNDRNGGTWVFARNSNGVWSQQGAKLIGTGSTKQSQMQGYKLALNADGNVLAIGGAPWTGDPQNSDVWLFTRNSSTWKQANIISLKDASFDGPITLSADGAILMIGGGFPSPFYDHGAIWCYKRTGEAWNMVNKISIADGYPPPPDGAISMMPNGAMMVTSATNNLNMRGVIRTYTATPALITLAPLDINSTGATVAGTADDNGSNATIVFRYWEAQKIGEGTTVTAGSITIGSGLASYKAVLKNLKPNTIYIYAISAITSSGTYTADTKYFTTSNAPVIYSFTPPLAQVGTTVAITGVNFKNITDVSFGGTAADKFNVVSPTLIEAIIAPGTTQGQIAVKNNEGTAIANGLNLFLTPQVNASSTVMENSSTVYLDIMPGDGYKYQWMKNGKIIAGATGTQLEVKEPASYTVRVSVDSLSQVSVPVVIVSKLVLPQNAFLVTTQNLTCRNSHDGKITVDATYDAYKYTVRITGNGLDKSVPFTKTTSFYGVEPGTYNVCITVDEDKNYKQCYTAVVSQPADLAVLSTINDANNTIQLSLNGGETYHINLNGVVHNTTANSVVLPLAQGKNTLSITTDKLCQGVIEKIINMAIRPVPYPNPFSGVLNVPIGDKQVKKAIINIYSVNGLLVLSKQLINVTGTITIQTADIELTGNYTLVLNADGIKQMFKIIKK